MTIQTEILKAQKNDSKRIAVIYSPFDQPYSKERWIRSKIDQDQMFVLALMTRTICGAIALVPFDKEMEIQTIAVDQEMIRKGFGAKLIEFAVNKARQENKKRLTVESSLKYNALEFYQRCGFVLEEPGVQYDHNEPFYRFHLDV